MIRGQGSRHEGFTLVEVLVAVQVFAVVIVATASLLVVATTQGTLSRRATDAAAIAQTEIELLRDIDADVIAAAASRVVVMAGWEYTVRREVTDLVPNCVNTGQPCRKQITVTVTWNLQGPRSYVAETIFTNLNR